MSHLTAKDKKSVQKRKSILLECCNIRSRNTETGSKSPFIKMYRTVFLMGHTQLKMVNLLNDITALEEKQLFSNRDSFHLSKSSFHTSEASS